MSIEPTVTEIRWKPTKQQTKALKSSAKFTLFGGS